MALSDTTVRQARISGNDYTLGDTDGLSLNVTARGGKNGCFRYYWVSFRSAATEEGAYLLRSWPVKPAGAVVIKLTFIGGV